VFVARPVRLFASGARNVADGLFAGLTVADAAGLKGEPRLEGADAIAPTLGDLQTSGGVQAASMCHLPLPLAIADLMGKLYTKLVGKQ
jgi:hypothetical protein